MITIDDKLYITKEVNNIIVDYATKIVFPQLFNELSFKVSNGIKEVSPLLINLNQSGNYSIYPKTEINLIEFISDFLKSLSKEKLTSLYFWYLNETHFKDSMDEIDRLEDDIDNENFDYQFGRSLAQQIYDPEGSGLDNKLFNQLKNIILAFASEFDLSLIEEDTVDEILQVMDGYPNSLFLNL